MVQKANTIWRDHETEGVPASGEHEPEKADIRAWGTYLESVIAAGTLSDAVWKDTKANLDADLAHAADTIGVVYDDSTKTNNGLYKKSGASGSGSWTQLTTFLPGYQFVTATDDGNSTANAMTMNTSPTLPSGDGVALVSFVVPVTNTSTTVTVVFDGGAELAVKTASGNDPAIGGLVEGMALLGVVVGSEFRMRSDQAAAAVLAGAEAQKEYAELWAQSPDPIPPEAGGDGSTDRSSKWWAEQAQGAIPTLFVTDTDALRAVDTASATAAYVKSLKRQFLWDSSDLSGTLVQLSATTTSVDAGTDTATAAGHGLLDGMPVIVDTAVDGLDTNTIYYITGATANTFQLADSLADAAAGTPRDLTGTTNFTVSVLGDPEQADYVIKPGDALDGSDGAWVGDDSGAPQGSAIGGLTYLRRSSAFKAGEPMLPEYFGCTPDSSSASVVTKNTAGLRKAMEEPFALMIPIGKTYYIGDELPLSNTGCKHVYGRGTLRTGETGHRFFVGTGISDLLLEDFAILGTSPTGLSAGSSNDNAITLVEATRATLRNLRVNGTLGIGARLQGGKQNRVIGGDYSANLAPVQFGGETDGLIQGIFVDGHILAPEVFNTGIQLQSTDAHAYGPCKRVRVIGNTILNLAYAQSILAHSGIDCEFLHNITRQSTHGISISAFSGALAADLIERPVVVGNNIDCDTSNFPTLDAAALSVSGSYGIQVAQVQEGVLNPIISRNIVRNANTVAQNSNQGGIIARGFLDGIISENQIVSAYTAGIVIGYGSTAEIEGNMIDTVTGLGAAIRILDSTNGASDISVRGGRLKDAAYGVRNEDTANSVYIAPDVRMTGITTLPFASAVEGKEKRITTAVTSIDLSDCDTVVFDVGSAHTVSEHTNAVPGRIYTFKFTNGNTTIGRTGGFFRTNGSADIVGANRMITRFYAHSATELRQVAEESTNG